MRALPDDGAGARQGRGGDAPRVRFAKLDTEADPAVSARFGIRGIPLLIAFRGGREAARQAGAQPAKAIEAWVRGAVTAGPERDEGGRPRAGRSGHVGIVAGAGLELVLEAGAEAVDQHLGPLAGGVRVERLAGRRAELAQDVGLSLGHRRLGVVDHGWSSLRAACGPPARGTFASLAAEAIRG